MTIVSANVALREFAEGRIHHLNHGLCPDIVAGYESRDPDCPVCAALTVAAQPVALVGRVVAWRVGTVHGHGGWIDGAPTVAQVADFRDNAPGSTLECAYAAVVTGPSVGLNPPAHVDREVDFVVHQEALHSLEKRVEQAELWRKAVVTACMPTEACFDGSDPEKTISNLIDWHLQNERGHVAQRSQAAPRTSAVARAAGVSMASMNPLPHDHLAGGPDPLMSEAEEIVRSSGKPSISYLQRKLRIGYNRTARLLESLEKLGVVSAMDARGARVVLERKP